MTFRLVRAVVLLEVALVGTMAVVIYFESEHFFRRHFDSTLQARAEAFASLIENDGGTLRLQEPVSPISKRSPRSSRPDFYWAWSDDGTAVEASPPIDDSTTEIRDQGSQPGLAKRLFFNARWSDRRYRAIWMRPQIPATRVSTTSPDGSPQGQPRTVNVLMAVARDSLDDAVADLLQSLLLLSGVIIAAMATATVLLVHWGLGPIRKSASRLQTITATNIETSKLAEAEAPKEIRPFMRAFDDLLARLADAFRQQRSFTAYASHELRTPMAVIKSTIQTCLLRDRDPADYRDALAEVLDDLTRMEHMVDQLLVLARLDAEVERDACQPVDLAELLLGIAHNYQSLATEAGVTIEPPTLGPGIVTGNPELLERMLSNLVGNAIRHNQPGGRVSVTCRTVAESGRRWGVVEVADTGPGIPPEALHRIFERFFRLDPARSRSAGGGSGLGLAIVREIVQRHGGTVTAENRPEGGALFRVRLPAADDE